MRETKPDFTISRLGECRIQSPMPSVHFVDDDDHVLYDNNLQKIEVYFKAGKTPPFFEKAGPREKIYFDPSKLKCALVTCGGLCPGLNDIIRAITLELYYGYGVRHIFGIRYGLQGFIPAFGHQMVELKPSAVTNILEMGGSILGSSRGPQPVEDVVDSLERMNIGILFMIGGDGTIMAAS